MNDSKIQNPKSKIFLGVDGGQSHTEAIVADEFGNILGRGLSGASNHAEHPGGRERLHNAVSASVAQALQNADLSLLEETIFVSAHFGMTGGADFKEEIISSLIKAERLRVDHDAPTALFGAAAGKPGVVVIAGTGSVVYGENERGQTTQIGGLGYLFSDEGSAFWLATQIIRLAIKEQDGLIGPAGLEQLVLSFFKCKNLREVTNDFYFAKMSRDSLAGLARAAHDAALGGNQMIQEQIKSGARILAESVASAARRLQFANDFPVAGVGGMFRGVMMKKFFADFLRELVPESFLINPRFGPATGALLLAYQQANVQITPTLLANLEKSEIK